MQKQISTWKVFSFQILGFRGFFRLPSSPGIQTIAKLTRQHMHQFYKIQSHTFANLSKIICPKIGADFSEVKSIAPFDPLWKTNRISLKSLLNIIHSSPERTFRDFIIARKAR